MEVSVDLSSGDLTYFAKMLAQVMEISFHIGNYIGSHTEFQSCYAFSEFFVTKI